MSRRTALLGWAATLMGVLMYLSYVDQIRINLTGAKGSLILPLATVANCTLWLAYGYLRERRDWPLVIANLPGILLGAAAFATAL